VAVEELANDRDEVGPPHPLGVVLHPARVRRRGRVLHLGAGEHPARPVDQHALRRRRPDVDPEHRLRRHGDQPGPSTTTISREGNDIDEISSRIVARAIARSSRAAADLVAEHIADHGEPLSTLLLADVCRWYARCLTNDGADSTDVERAVAVISDLYVTGTASMRTIVATGFLEVLPFAHEDEYAGVERLPPPLRSALADMEAGWRLDAHRCAVRVGAGGLVDSRWCSAHLVDVLRDLPATLTPADVTRPELLLHREARTEVAFAPLDVVNPAARLLLVGLTPGRAQALLALQTVRTRLGEGVELEEALVEAKATASFAGPMRHHLVAMLDDVGVADALSVGTCAELFTARTDLVSSTSVVCHPVFVRGGRNYGGSGPRIDQHPLLSAFARQVLRAHLELVPHALVVPLGRAVAAALPLAGVDAARVLSGMPHPSGANGHRVTQFADQRETLQRVVRSWVVSARGTPRPATTPARR